jgi:hypothetical protein
MDQKVVDAARAAFQGNGSGIVLGACVHDGAAHPEPVISIPLAMMNRHGLIAGATGTGKTKTLQLIAEQLSSAGVPVFLADVKGDMSGVAIAGESSPRVTQRAGRHRLRMARHELPGRVPEPLGRLRRAAAGDGVVLRAAAAGQVLGLNATQSSVLSLVFKYCDDKGLLLLDLSDLRAVLQHLTGDGAAELAAYGGMSKQTVGVLLRELVELEQQGADRFFGEPEFDLQDLLQVERDGRGLISVLELKDTQDRPALFSTFMMWMLARLYNTLPEAAISRSRSWSSSSTRRTCCSRMRARTSRSRSSASCASCAPRASASSSSRRARRTSRPTSSASSATGCSTRCAPSRRTTRRRCAPPRAPSPRRASTTSRRRSPRSASARRW